MKRFLVMGLIFLMGFLFANVSGYAEEKEDRGFLGLGAGKIYTDAHAKQDFSFDFSILYQSGRWKKFFEVRASYNGTTPEFSITFNWMLWRKISYTTVHTGDGIWKKPALIGLFIGTGPCGIKVDSEKDYKNFVINFGVKVIYSILYFDAKMNSFLFGGGSDKFYPSISFGILF